MIYYTKDNEVLDYICWKHYIQSDFNLLGMIDDTDEINNISEIMEFLNLGWDDNDSISKLSGILEMVIKANPGILDYGVFLPSNIPIELPELKSDYSQNESVKLWD